MIAKDNDDDDDDSNNNLFFSFLKKIWTRSINTDRANLNLYYNGDR